MEEEVAEHEISSRSSKSQDVSNVNNNKSHLSKSSFETVNLSQLVRDRNV
jgi:hypothetical protein